MRYLRQSTSVDLPIGPFIDQTDGFTAETALTLTQPDIRLKKNAAAWAQKAAAQTLSHEEAGWYEVTLDATDTDTCGQLMLAVHESGALPVWSEFHVLEEAVYDALFAASAPGYLQPTVAARTLDVSAGGEAGLDWANIGSPTTAQNLSATNIDVDQIVASVSGAVGSVTGAVGSVTGAVGSVAAGGITAASLAADAITAAKIADGAIDAATFAAGAINAAAIAADAITDAKVASDVTIASVTGAVGSVTGAVGSVTGNVGGNVTGSVGSVATGGIVAASFAANAINAAKLDPDVTTELQAGLATAAALATVDGIVDDILLDTAEIGTAGAGLTNIDLPNQTMNITGNLSGSVGSVTGAVGSVTGAVGSVGTGGIAAASFAAGAINAAAIAADAIGASELAADAVAEIADAVWDETLSGHTTAGSFGRSLQIIRDGNAVSGAAGVIVLDAGASALNDFYNNTIIAIVAGTGAGQARVISDYVGATKTATVNGNWITSLDTTSVFVILPFGSIPGASAPTAAENADAVWDELLSGHVVAGSSGEALAAAGTAGDPWTTALPGAYGAGTAGKIVGDNLPAILLDTAEIGTAGAGLTNINLPDQAMNVTGNITGNLSGSVGSVTGAVGSVTAGVTLAASAVQAIWDALTSALTTVGSIGKLLVDNVNATISSRSSHSAADVWTAGTRTLTSFGTLAADVWASVTRTLTAATNITSTGGTTVPQTGDSFARLGAPAGASVSADIAAIEAQTDDIGVAGAGLTAVPWNAAWDAEVESEATDALTVAALATSANLATVDTVVDSILALLIDARVEPGQGAPAATEDPLTKLDFLYKIARNKLEQTSTELKIYDDAGTTVDHKATVSDTGTVYTRGEITSGP